VTPGDGKLTLTWRAPLGSQGVYTVGWKTAVAPRNDASAAGDPSTGWVYAEGVAVTEHTIAGLVNGTDYDVQVRRVVIAEGADGKTAPGRWARAPRRRGPLGDCASGGPGAR